MELYRFEALVDGNLTFIVVAATSEEKAFELAEREIEKSYIKLPVIKELSLLEKKKIGQGTAYVL